MINEALVQIREYLGDGYMPLVDFESWRVAILRYLDVLRPENLETLECHLETDEVFVLLQGQCILYIGDATSGEMTQIAGIVMEPLKLYNIRKGVYHSHSLSQDASVLVIENQNTTDENSRKIRLSDSQRSRIVYLGENLYQSP